MINYSFVPARVFEWIRAAPMFILQLPDQWKLIYKRIPDFMNEEYVKQFSVNELRNIDMEALEYLDIVKWFEDIYEAVSPRAASEGELEQHPIIVSSPAFSVEFEPVWDGKNWQDKLHNDVQTITDTEPRLLGNKCPICQDDFKPRQRVLKYRCGHAVCIG